MMKGTRDFKIEIVSAEDADEHEVMAAARNRKTWSADAGIEFRMSLLEDVQRMQGGTRRCEEYGIRQRADSDFEQIGLLQHQLMERVAAEAAANAMRDSAAARAV
jgi:hypothetical protein